MLRVLRFFPSSPVSRLLLSVLLFVGPLLAGAAPAWASNTSGDLPWNEPLQILRDNITGPTVGSLLFIAVAVGVAMWGWSSHNDTLARAGKAVTALAIVVLLATFLPNIGIDYALV